MSMGQKRKQGFSYSSLEAWFSLVHKHKRKHKHMCKQVKTAAT